MKILEFHTKGHTDIIDITAEVQDILDKENVRNGVVHLFVIGSTAALTTCESDERVYDDIKEVLEKIAPYKKNWKHHQTWGDDNGASHIRASLFGPSLTIPVSEGKLVLGTWQKIILLDFDTSSRMRKVVLSFLKTDM
ncbi:secondary thiamine-phosphate synthase enzyme [Candidatus Gottesmanbacteria bacterium CG11_big_fil_rev_8_21_14_0_20_37_11]|uniref:Secondary thiamine-phosphate synthase enzyme n=1 Tax=Candidatus Gottesmanbacteria bacterium CG11_big_fil_rev_8_21_14_0_20_37_11 TaxID=1974575 RepID=A0A2H0NI15_9BACT|nr:MAG: secondary thiamine-phosphate synthase enzyme [Candidatus Gottesmanbacteria bacterium CG11_big_fil_rev_8_21_14_0_20_37_11]